METPSLGCLHGEIEPKWHHVLSQANTCSPGQGTLEKKFSGQQSMSTEIPPDKKYKNFHYLEGVSTELQDSFENTKSNFRSSSKRTTDTGTDKSNQKISKRFLHGKKNKLYDLGKTNCLSEFYILLFYPSVPARLTDDHPNISKKNLQDN